jgi:radical SAM superfamily enzyme YgiQ (UPF0313 family)
MKVIFSTPPYTSEAETTRIGLCIPLGLGYICAVARERGLDVEVVDATLLKYDVKEAANAILNKNPDFVGLGSYTATISSVYELANELKRNRPDLRIVGGGPHISALPERTLRECPAFDAVIIGEGDYAFSDYCLGKKSNGILYRKDGKIMGDKTPAFVSNLDDLPLPARDLFDIEAYKKCSFPSYVKDPPATNITTSRGCPFRCIYCCKIGSGGTNFRARSAQSVVNEMKVLRDMGFKEIEIVDDNFTFDMNRTLEICKLIKEQNLHLSFSLPNGIRVDRVNESLLREMRRSGFYLLNFGLECADNEVLRRIKKGITVEQVEKSVNLAKKVGFSVGLFIIIGLPSSTPEKEEKTVDFVKRTNPDFIGVAPCPTPYPGSELWTEVNDAFDGNDKWQYFRHSYVDKLLYRPEGLTFEQMKHYHDKLYHNFYKRPIFWLKQFVKHPFWTARRMNILFSIAKARKFL